MKDLKTKEFVVFDVETTGLSCKRGDRIIEVAAKKIKNFNIVDSFESLINPECEISHGAFLVNGINSQMVADAPLAKNILPDLMEFIGDCCIVGHNVRFDINFLNNELFLAGYPLREDLLTIDTRKMAKGLFPALGQYSLQAVAFYLGVNKRQQHRAMADVQMTLNIFLKMLQMAQKNNIDNFDVLLDLFSMKKTVKQKSGTKIKRIISSIDSKSELNILYMRTDQGTTVQRIMPKKMLGEGKYAVLVAFCPLKGEELLFNMNNIFSLI